jgi:glycosyltransferase involved in cell wall biosynthesis
MDARTAPAAGGIALVLPARNEAATVAAVIDRTPDTVAGLPVRCVVVDDGSTDATADLARLAGATVIGHATGRGLGAAVRTGLRHAVDRGARVIAFCDADGEYAPEELDDLVLPILSGDADYVVGSRFAGAIGRMHPHRRAGNRVLTWVLRHMTGTPISDGQSGYRALSASAADAAEIIHDYNYAQVLTLNLLRQGFRYAEVPISYTFREHGRSFVRLHRYLRAVVPAVRRELARSCITAAGSTVASNRE